MDLVVKATPIFSGLIASPGIAYGATSVALAGTVSSTTGPTTINAADGDTVTATINGHAVSGMVSGGSGAFTINYNDPSLASLTVGSSPYAITYSYGGNSAIFLNAATNNSTTSLAVSKAPPPVTVNVGTYTYNGSPQGPNSVITPSTGTVSYQYSGTANGEGSYGPSSEPPAAAGSYSVTASVAADANYSAASSSATPFTIGRATPTVTVANSPVAYNGTQQAATVSSSVGGTVSNVKYEGSGTVPTAAATYAVTADFTPSDAANYNSLMAAAAGNFVIGQVTPTVGIASSSQTNGYHDSVHFMATLPGYAVGNVQFKVDGAALGALAALSSGAANSDSTTNLARGNHTVAVEYAGDANVAGSTNNLTQTVTNHPPVVKSITMGAQSATPAMVAIIRGKYAPTDADGDALSVSAVQNPSGQGGSVTTDGTNFTYTAADSFAGTDTFTYTVSDGFGGTSIATVTVNVSANGSGFNRVSGPVNNGDGTATISYAGIPGYHYALDTASNVALPVAWSPVATNTAGTDGQLHFTFSITAGEGYFRTRYVP